MLSPAENQAVGPSAAERTVEIYERAMRTGQGVFALNSAWKAQVLGISPRDMEYQAMTTGARDAVGVTFGVPGTRLNLLSGGYGQARQEARSYWENLTGDLGAAFEDVWSRLTDSDDIGIAHDISGVEALQVANLDRLEQAIRLVSLGASPAEALAYVGLEDAPSGEPSAALYTASPAATRPDEPQDPRPRADQTDAISAYLAGAAVRYEATQGPRGAPEVGRLATALEAAGLPVAAADAIAAEVVADTDAAVAVVVARNGGALVSGFADLAAFGPHRSARIALRATTAAQRAA